jgi:hypothetical protein
VLRFWGVDTTLTNAGPEISSVLLYTSYRRLQLQRVHPVGVSAYSEASLHAFSLYEDIVETRYQDDHAPYATLPGFNYGSLFFVDRQISLRTIDPELPTPSVHVG